MKQQGNAGHKYVSPETYLFVPATVIGESYSWWRACVHRMGDVGILAVSNKFWKGCRMWWSNSSWKVRIHGSD